MDGYMKGTKSSEAKRRQKAPVSTTRPWIPAGVTGVTPLPGSSVASTDPRRSRTSNYIAQSSYEHHQARLHNTGSMETSVYNAVPIPTGQFSTFSGVKSTGGVPTLAMPQKNAKAQRQRTYVSLDAPGMGDGAPDKRMNRAEVGMQYRESYRTQHITKNQAGFVPATFHVKTGLRTAKKIESESVPQSGGSWTKAQRRALDQQSDVEKYRHSHGILPASFDKLIATAIPGSERLAVGSRAGRKTLSQSYHPGTIVHPSELRTKTEQMEVLSGTRKAQARQDRLAVNPQFTRQAEERAKKRGS